MVRTRARARRVALKQLSRQDRPATCGGGGGGGGERGVTISRLVSGDRQDGTCTADGESTLVRAA